MSIALRLPEELEKRLSILAKKTHKSKSFFAREALEAQIEDMEDYYLALAVDNDEAMPVYTIEEVEKMCGLED